MNEERVFERILFCTDFSKNADFAFDYALALAGQAPGATLFLLHVIPEPEAQFWKTYIYEVDDVDRKARQDIDAKIAETYRPRVPSGLDLQVRICIGRDTFKILEVAQEEKVDLIVIGRHGHSGMGKVLFGNVTERIARKADCPVLIVPLSYEERSTRE